MNLADLLNIDPADFSWHDLAKCRSLEIVPTTDLFFDLYEKDEQVAKATDQMCLSCPVQKECLEYGIQNTESGVWGGVFLENGKASPARNAHKTKEDWQRIVK